MKSGEGEGGARTKTFDLNCQNKDKRLPKHPVVDPASKKIQLLL